MVDHNNQLHLHAWKYGIEIIHPWNETTRQGQGHICWLLEENM